ncbi:phytanoyl-CoA dioxygenase family protein [Allosphingosinicella deserti]|uniref:Phytanoyl-CoA dioxygenase n=1 Tax=Allosphingosinicella deserti TaxID=2116704 RepID=A0A2P7QYH6_9SPHN|nr:phytanoyl-CoA dioxygenase family protein [Sphingomonas deserti]PSJ43007.1 phytanoyl-CoA dioxygenase [Sphingomonas deserti]
MDLDLHGAERHGGALNAHDLDGLTAFVEGVLRGRPGARLTENGGFRDMLTVPDAVAATRLGPKARPVRAMLFDKSAARNWSLGWHQDRTVAVQAQAEVPGYTAWTVKQGIIHVVPPVALLQRMLTMRIHLDPVGIDAAPLLIAPGSHRHGLIPETAVAGMVTDAGIAACLADAGDLWVYASLILHASERSRADRRRRVLQIFYSADDLPPPLEWLGV